MCVFKTQHKHINTRLDSVIVSIFTGVKTGGYIVYFKGVYPPPCMHVMRSPARSWMKEPKINVDLISNGLGFVSSMKENNE